MVNARLFGTTGAQVNAGAYNPPISGAATASGGQNPNVSGFGAGTVARRSLIIWGASVAWLFLVWRAVEGY